MRAQYRTYNGRITIEVTGETIRDLFRGIANAQEAFEADAVCGMCQSECIGFRHRKVDKNDYYEMVCNSCRARLQFGQHKEGGTLFAKRQDKDGNPLRWNGWSRYEPKPEREPEPQRAPSRRSA